MERAHYVVSSKVLELQFANRSGRIPGYNISRVRHLDFFFDTCGLTGESTEVVQLRTAYGTTTFYRD